MKNRSKILMLSCILIFLSSSHGFCQDQMWIWEYVIKNGKKNDKNYDEEIFYISNDTLFRHTLDDNINHFNDFSIIKKVGEEHFLYGPADEYTKEYPLRIVFKYKNDTTLVLWSQDQELKSFYRLVEPTKTRLDLSQINSFLFDNPFKANLSLLDRNDEEKTGTISFHNVNFKPENDRQFRSLVINKGSYYFLFSHLTNRRILPIIHFNKKGFSLRTYGSKAGEIKFVKTKK